MQYGIFCVVVEETSDVSEELTAFIFFSPPRIMLKSVPVS
jgi:hypothetical protein